MKANELRIGNYILMDFFSDNTDEPHRVIAKDIANIVRFKNKIEGVPLTEEWMVKFGLSENMYSDRHSKRFDLPNDNFVIHLDGDGEHGIYFEGGNLTYINFVHQLQNLYFALTGEELEVINGK